LRGIAGSAVAVGAVGLVAERTDAKKDDKKKKKCDKKTKQKCKKRGGRTCVDGKCICDRCKGCLDTCDGDDQCASFPRFEDGAIVCSQNVFGDCGECTTAGDCDTKYPISKGFHECIQYHGPICATVQCTKTEGVCMLKCGAA